MSETNGYLIPDKCFPHGQFTKVIRSILELHHVTNQFYDKDQARLAAGKSSFLLFSENINNNNIAFEYAEIHDTANSRLIPGCSPGGFGANCKNCKGNIDDNLSDTLNDFYEHECETGVEIDMTTLEISCSSCGHINKLTDIKFDSETEIKNQFISFIDIESGFDLDKIKKIGQSVNCNFNIIYERI